eukprot:TRINITY_DN41689_c1_g1_i2.p1 TRINITY_DN41689_c1_g1~~TRINITY_DN41689_c1_g1_i2.p1  ORF type:complete len:737 (-),score=175.02 TRINITY_DN41689_c1_g1_i2:50-2182(-)
MARPRPLGALFRQRFTLRYDSLLLAAQEATPAAASQSSCSSRRSSRRCFAAGAPQVPRPIPGQRLARPTTGGPPADVAAFAKATAAAPKWPFLRNKALSAKISGFFDGLEGGGVHGDAASGASCILWVTGASGSGSSTAVQAVLGQAAAAGSGAAASRSLLIVFDCAAHSDSIRGASAASASSPLASASARAASSGSASARASLPSTAAEVDRALLEALEAVLQSQLSEQLAQQEASAAASTSSASTGDDDLVRAMVETVLAKHPEAAGFLRASVEFLGARGGLLGALPGGTEMLECKAAAANLDLSPAELVSAAVNEIINVKSKLVLLRPATPVHVALALLREAGTRSAASGAPAAADAPPMIRPTLYLLAAAEGLAAALGRDLVFAVLGADALQSPQAGAASAAVLPLLESLASSARASPAIRLLLQSSDGAAAAQAVSRGAAVLTVDEWPEAMAKAIFVPRFLEESEEAAWEGIWSSVGGHASHLRRVSELLVEERHRIELEKTKAMLERQQQDRDRAMELQGSVDMVEARRDAERLDEEDSYRADAREPASAAEQLLRKLTPEALGKEVAVFEEKMEEFARHPLLRAWQPAASGEGKAGVALALAEVLLPLCSATRPPTCVPAPPGGLGKLSDPLLLALLDVGLLIPKWDAPEGPRLVLANALTRSLLHSWLVALQSELPWRDTMRCSSQRQRLESQGASSEAPAK